MTENQPTPQEASPLAEVKSTSLEDLFNKDPLTLTQQDLEDTVAYLRKARETFLKDESAKPRKENGKAVPKEAMKPTLTVDDLQL